MMKLVVRAGSLTVFHNSNTIFNYILLQAPAKSCRVGVSSSTLSGDVSSDQVPEVSTGATAVPLDEVSDKYYFIIYNFIIIIKLLNY